MKILKSLNLLFLLIVFNIPHLFFGQDKTQFVQYLNGVEKRLDSLKKSIQIYDAQTQEKIQLLEEQNITLSKTTVLLEEKRFEIDSLNYEINEKTSFINSQGTFLGVFMGIAGIAIFAIMSLIVTIREKKQINRNLEEKNNLIKKQFAELKQKNKEITDSIKYAKRIQDAILPSSIEITEAYPNSFIYYKPKDIVSGDFYWLTEKNEKIFFVTADCTGHGVPGALMSMLGVSYLNEIINEKNFSKTSDIMNELKKSIINSLGKNDTNEGMKDGMDMVIYTLDKKNLKLSYSAANNGLYIIRNNEIIKLSADKLSVSAGPMEHLLFNEFVFDLQLGDFIITYSDGFADQFGGPKGKKFKYKQLQELLIQLNSRPVSTIPSHLNSAFDKWKGGLEQVDDVLIIGVKV